MRAFLYIDDAVQETTSADEVRAAHAAGHTLWVDLEAQTAETDALLADTFAIHALTVDDIWSERTSPKVEEFTGYLYVLAHAVGPEHDDGVLSLRELDVVIGPHFVLTHDNTGGTTRPMAEDLRQSPRVMCRGAVWLGHALLDRLVDAYLPVIDGFDEEIESLENDVLAKAGTPDGPEVLGCILALKRAIQALRRVAGRQREVLLRLSRGEFDAIPADALPYFRNVHDHFLRVVDLADSYRDMASGALEAYLSVQSNRMNEVMKTLTMISTVMLPLTFIAGLYGMNFEDMPELHWVFGYPLALVLMIAVGAGTVFWFRRKRWLE
jgi:magnesium transporter